MPHVLDALLSNNLYLLKRQYGSPLIFCSLQDYSTDYRTGEKGVDYYPVPVAKVIALPSHITRSLVASVARISTNKLTAYGGQYNTGDRGFIIEGQDILDLPVRKDDWLLHRGRRYSPILIFRVFQGSAWLVTARAHPGQPLTFHVAGHSALVFQEGTLHA